MNLDEMKAKLDKLEKENEQLKKTKNREIFMKVSQKGAASLYGLGRFPVTLYKEQWEKLLDYIPHIQEFLKKHTSELKVK